MQGVGVDEVAIGGEAGIVPIFDMRAGYFVTALIGALTARSLLLDPKLILINEPSIGLSPKLVQETFAALQELRAAGVTILLIEQNARPALEISDHALVLELGQARIFGLAKEILHDPRVAELFLGGLAHD